jgi:1,4-dihydroxy-2-naphthoate octaprenyltransferase
VNIRGEIEAWLTLSRIPFLSVGVLPYILGGVLSTYQKNAFRWDISLWGMLGVVMIMLGTYYAGEYWDYLEDSYSAKWGSTRFSGGSQVIQRGLLSRKSAYKASVICFGLASIIVSILYFGYDTGLLTIPLGLIGLIGGIFYSAKPIRWVTRGVGEVWIALCYGWLPIAAGYYLQSERLTDIVHWLALPIGLSIFNVILLNEYPDYEADRAAKKKNLLVRMGRNKSAILFAVTSIGIWITILLSRYLGVPPKIFLFYIPVFFISFILVSSMVRGEWRNRSKLEKLCAGNLLVNLGTTVAYILAFVG